MDDDNSLVLRFGGPNEPPIPPYTSSSASPLRHDRIVVLTVPPLLPAAHDWTLLADDGLTCTPNYGALASRYGEIIVKPEAANGDGGGSAAAVQETMRFAEFLQRVRQGEALYLRDWHLVRELRHRASGGGGDDGGGGGGVGGSAEEHRERFYDCPPWFRDDWLNAFLDQDGDDDDYRFVYIGGPCTHTLLHVDVLHSYSWSANICGTKTWTFFPPSQTRYLSNARNETITDIRTAPQHQFPQFHTHTTPITLIQQPGQIVCVPSGWYHQVVNSDTGVTISINHNWINARGLGAMVAGIVKDVGYIRHAIAEHRVEMVFHARRLLRLLNRGGGYQPWEDGEAVAEGLRAVWTAWTTLRVDAWATIHGKLDEDVALFEQLQAAVAALPAAVID
ncbi:JmjC domain-containing protein 4 [Geranomyces michiganensis]|nr:JmjC domain-containing protein 4 [Geranomyces michiganensis]